MSDEVAEEIVLDPEAAEQRLLQSIALVVDAAQFAVHSAPYGIIPDPRHMSVLRDAVKRYELVKGEADATAVLIKMAGEQDTPKDIETVGL